MTTLHVFISSPGDCAEERKAMRDVVRRVSASDAARAAGIELQPLLWEELPPGQAEAGDLQSRVNALLERYGLKRYEIYAGAMKDRLGTPTAKYRSGTIEELETAISGHRRAQVPAEVLFYFVGPGTDEVRAEIAHREAEERRISDWIVQSAYLRALAGNTVVWPRHESYVRNLFARRVGADLSLVPDGMDAAAIDLLARFTPAQIIDLLALPAGIVSDELEGKWEPRWYVLHRLAEAGPVHDEIASAVLARLPVDDELRMRVVRAVSRNGGKVARNFLAREFLRDRTGNRGYLDLLADLGEEQFFLERMAEAADAAVLDAAARLPEEPRCRVFSRAVQRFNATHAPKLWVEAGRCRIEDEVLIEAAVRALRQGKPAPAVAPVKYLVAIGREREVLGDVARLLRAADAFDWVALAQELPERSAKDATVEAVLRDQARLVVTDRAEPRTFSAAGRGVWNPLLAAYASGTGVAGARNLLEWAGAGNPVEVPSRADDAPILYRAYCLWLAAPGAVAADLEVTSLLAENNAPLVRAAAAVCLGATAPSRPS